MDEGGGDSPTHPSLHVLLGVYITSMARGSDGPIEETIL